MSVVMTTNERPKKLQRISQACDLCHRRSIRCRPSTEVPHTQCQNCFDFAVDCTYNRPSRRRRNPSQPLINPPNVLPVKLNPAETSPTSEDRDRKSIPTSGVPTLQSISSNDSPDYTGAYFTVREGINDDLLGVAWRSFALASLDTIEQYLEIYMDVVYPLYPLFHGPTLRERIRKRHHLTDRGFFASVMAACALAAARARDGAIATSRYPHVESPGKNSEVFFAAAQDAIQKDLTKVHGLGYLKACALLALCSIQYGQLKAMHMYIGHYTSLCAMQQFHDEAQWPSDTTVVEREERRRLFWSMYTLDIYTSVCFDSVVKSQETHSNVRYPSEIDDNALTTGVSSPTSDAENWLRGWNFNTDLYRILEHTVKRMRRNKQTRDDRIAVTRLLISDGIPDAQIMENVLGLYYQLAQQFRNNVPATGDKARDFIGLQAANIQVTLQLVRMTLFSTNLTHDVYQRCNLAEQVLSTFLSIAPEYLRAISTPIIYHLGGVGQILGSVMEGVLSEDSYQRVRALLVSMADLLQGLDCGLQPTSGASRDLRKQIHKIDLYMAAQRQLISSVSAPHQNITMPMGTQNGYPAQLNHNMGLHMPLDEFQLPADLVNDGAWPWPFEFAVSESAMLPPLA